MKASKLINMRVYCEINTFKVLIKDLCTFLHNSSCNQHHQLEEKELLMQNQQTLPI